MSHTIRTSPFLDVVHALGGRYLPARKGSHELRDLRKRLESLPNAVLPDTWNERIPTEYSDWSFAIPIHKHSPFFAVEITPPLQSSTPVLEIDSVMTPTLVIEHRTILLFGHPPYPLSRLGYPHEDVRVYPDRSYIEIPGPDQLPEHGSWRHRPGDVQIAPCPESFWYFVSPVRWDLVEQAQTIVAESLLATVTPDLYSTVSQHDLWHQYKLLAGERGYDALLSYHQFENALAAFGIVSHAPAGGERFFRGIRYR